jgi:hypothetical protein
MRRPWILGLAAAAWLGVALLTVLWPDQPGTDWDYTGDLGAAFGALSFSFLMSHWASSIP